MTVVIGRGKTAGTANASGVMIGLFETAFLADLDKKALGSAWLYNGRGMPEAPGDLGYWVGYRITKAYYKKAEDKQAALCEILELRDGKAFLAKSGWHPGIVLD